MADIFVAIEGVDEDVMFVLVPMHFGFFQVAVAADHPEVGPGHGEPGVLRSGEFVVDGFAPSLGETLFANWAVSIRISIHPSFTLGSGATFVVTALIPPVVKLAIIFKVFLSQSMVAFSSDFIGDLK